MGSKNLTEAGSEQPSESVQKQENAKIPWEAKTSRKRAPNNLQKVSRNRKIATFLGSEVSGNSHSRQFPRISASLSRPESWEWNFSLPFLFPKIGNGIFLGIHGNFLGICIPESRECNFSLPFLFPKVRDKICHSCSRKLEMEFSFPFQTFQNGICCSRSRSPKVIPAHPCLG